jgi:hypothetical protein
MDNLCVHNFLRCVPCLERITLNKERIKEGLALVKISGDIEHLTDAKYNTEDVDEVMKHVRYAYADNVARLSVEGEELLNDISMR